MESEETKKPPTAAELIAQGIPRATAYRIANKGKRKVGKPKPAKPEVVTDAPVEAPLADVLSTGGLAWARAILWAAENIKVKRMTKRQAGSILNWSMWEFGRDEPKSLLVQLVPRALAILDKQKESEAPPEIDREELDEIADMEELLEAAIAESQATV